jgi:molybdate transport system permease protein
MVPFHLTPMEIEALRLSLSVSLWAVLGSLIPGIFLAWILARIQFPGRAFLDGIVHLPLVLPPVVTGYILLVLMGRNGPIGGLIYSISGLSFAFNWKGAALAAGIMAFPLFVRAVRLSLENMDRGLEDAARTLGAGKSRVFFTITLPLALPGIITGTILAFARSLGEFGATITFVSNIPGETRTLPLALYTITQQPDGEVGALRLCIISVVIALLAIMFSDLLARRRMFRMKGSK